MISKAYIEYLRELFKIKHYGLINNELGILSQEFGESAIALVIEFDVFPYLFSDQQLYWKKHWDGTINEFREKLKKKSMIDCLVGAGYTLGIDFWEDEYGELCFAYPLSEKLAKGVVTSAQ
jgi:hypothetical protein